MEDMKKGGSALKGLTKKATSFDNMGVKDLKSHPNVDSSKPRTAVGEAHSINTGRVE